MPVHQNIDGTERNVREYCYLVDGVERRSREHVGLVDGVERVWFKRGGGVFEGRIDISSYNGAVFAVKDDRIFVATSLYASGSGIPVYAYGLATGDRVSGDDITFQRPHHTQRRLTDMGWDITNQRWLVEWTDDATGYIRAYAPAGGGNTGQVVAHVNNNIYDMLAVSGSKLFWFRAYQGAGAGAGLFGERYNLDGSSDGPSATINFADPGQQNNRPTGIGATVDDPYLYVMTESGKIFLVNGATWAKSDVVTQLDASTYGWTLNYTSRIRPVPEQPYVLVSARTPAPDYKEYIISAPKP